MRTPDNSANIVSVKQGGENAPNLSASARIVKGGGFPGKGNAATNQAFGLRGGGYDCREGRGSDSSHRQKALPHRYCFIAYPVRLDARSDDIGIFAWLSFQRNITLWGLKITYPFKQ